MCVIDIQTRKQARFGTHIEPLLRAHFFHEQDLWDPQLGANVWDGLAIHKVLAQLHVLPQRLHLPQRQGVVLVADPDHRELVGDLAVVRLQPRH